ncbi:MAG: hypothetical protein ACI9KE_002352 [Polyangiales bacterium]
MISASLGQWSEKAAAVTHVLRIAGKQSEALEASVRHQDGTFTGHRMMIEGVDSLTALAILNVLGFDLQGSLIVRAAKLSQDLVVIGGWDAGGEALVGKFYINASDASLSRRERLARALDLPEEAHAPHVIGFNIRHGRVGPVIEAGPVIETKVYDQRADCPEEEVPPFVAQLQGKATPAGLVRSRVVAGGAITTKAWFVAPRAEDAPSILERLEGFDAEQTYACLPYAPGPIKSIGGPPDGSSWTIYFKPEGEGDSPYALEPAACFSIGSSTGKSELGLYITPNEHAAQAYCRTVRYALSYRVREGRPAPTEIDALMAWSRQIVQTHEVSRSTDSSFELSPIDFSSPPEPWVCEPKTSRP